MSAAPKMLDSVVPRERPRGRVSLVGAGPGDPELLTLRAHRILTNASVLAYDELVSAEILALAPKNAERIAVGRRNGTNPDAPSIHPLVLERALAGLDVVRLKGGDPLVFGRGGEEAAELAALHIPFEIVPGISAALGAAASTGIPLTHRDGDGSSVTFATAHLAHSGGASEDDLATRIPREGTVVLYMGLSTLEATARALIERGLRSSTTPIAVVSRATRPDERVVVGNLSNIARIVREQSIATPALVIIGEVVSRRVTPTSPTGLSHAISGSISRDLHARALP